MATLVSDEPRFALARAARAVALSKGNLMGARAVVESHYGANTMPWRLVQRAIDGGPAIGDSTAALASAALLGVGRRSDLIGQINAVSPFLQVGFATRFLLQASGATGAWVAEGKPLPVTVAGLTALALDSAKVGAIYVSTIEQVRDWSTAGDAALARGLSAALNQIIAEAFTDPENTGEPGERPASVTSDAVVIPSTGSSSAALTADLAAVVEAFDGSLENAVWLANPGLAFAFGLLGGDIGRNLTATGTSSLAGLPLIANQGIPAGLLILLDPSSVAIAGPVLDVDSSVEASIEVQVEAAEAEADGKENGERADAGTSQWLSLWQENMLALKSVAFVNWVARPGAAVVLSGIFPAPAPAP